MRTRTSSTNSFNTVRTPLNTASALRTSYHAGTSSEPQLMPIDGSFSTDINDYPDDPLMPELVDTSEIHSTGIFGSAYDDSLNTPIDDQSVGVEADFNNMEPSINVSPIPITRIHSIHPKDQIIGDPKSADFQNCLFACFLSQVEPNKVNQALDDVSWVEAMQEELLQFKLLNVWTLVDLPKGKKAIGTKWVFMNKKDQRGIMVRNKARLVAQGHRQEEGIDYDEVFAPVARIEAIRLFLAYASYMDFTMYQMDVKSAFLYGTIEEEVYVNQPLGFEDPEFPNKVYKVEKALYGLHQAPRAWYETLSTYLLENRFRRASTPMETHKSLSTNAAEPDVDVHLYRSMIVKRIFRYLKGKPTLSLWYPKDSPMDLIAYSDSDYAGASIDRKSTTRGCQFLGSRIVSWQCKKQTIVANSTTEAEYIAASYCYSYEKKLIEMVKIHTDNNVADLLTKAFDVTRHQELASPKQTALALASPKQTAIGKDFPNPFMAGSLPKTIKQSNDPPLSRGYILGSGEDSLELMKLMENCTQIVCFVRKTNREICLELIRLGTTLSTVSVKLILLGKYYHCWMKFSSIKEPDGPSKLNGSLQPIKDDSQDV
ncbi:putative ribonuclease H-like domain-containing protein [Tanacetum coccineum]